MHKLGSHIGAGRGGLRELDAIALQGYRVIPQMQDSRNHGAADVSVSADGSFDRQRPPARLHVLLARGSPQALVIRRGPSRHVAVIAWNRAIDQFTLGQWLRGRIYERRCDLSPDGRHWVYFAMHGRCDGPAHATWTAIARAPYLKAETLMRWVGTYHGGGLFTSDDEVWVNQRYGYDLLKDSSHIKRMGKCSPQEYSDTSCLRVYYPRLQRDGWTMVSRVKHRMEHELTIFERRIDQRWTLRKLAYATSAMHLVGRGCYFDEHELRSERDGSVTRCPGWEWADLDGLRLVWAQAGCLYSTYMQPDGPGPVKLLFDFNPMAFEAIEAPY
ncbi:hypothetical protein [Ramlibacter rhizophilus]|uniref:Uncharacterized protein n=1 Tax=Ramlibacter rhizophilus TaxID=1781167 RepID=A0A4Z0BZN8_9BURK|nr:hypothetical protein [Ramlibacter rhizophilus]TFZ03429.1 hypothetical protein EZ242_06000 [Ramlibacter rhizophilus]